MNRDGIRLLLAACALACTGLAAAAATDGKDFLQEAIQGNLGELKVGALAQQKGQSQDVKDFGAVLEKDHAAANSKAIAAAKSLDVTVPSEPGAEQKKVYQTLSDLSGKQFDERFIQDMVEDHVKDIKKYSEEASQGSGPAASYAQQVLPKLRKHLSMAKRIQSGQGMPSAGTH